MKQDIIVNPSNVVEKTKTLSAGDRVVFTPGRYTERLSFSDLSGQPDQAIEFFAEPGAVLDGGQRFEDFNPRAQQISEEQEKLGKYPGIQTIIMEGFFVFTNCDWVTVRGFYVEGVWPTVIAIDNCRHVLIDDFHIRESTFAVFAMGPETEHIIVENCNWLQDITKGDLWFRIGWHQMHDGPAKPNDSRAYDGDFFRAVNIRGNVTIRNNTVSHAFNGVHMYNRNKDKTLNNNVRIYGNTFNYIRDNPIEPENAASNWWVYNNRMFNCHKWFSFEMAVSGYFFVFGNVGWFDSLPGPISDDQYGGAVFKLPVSTEVTEGKHYVFHNSWYLRSSYIKKKHLPRFYHFNNAIQYCQPGNHGAFENQPMCVPAKPFFGKGASIPPKTPYDVKKQFTREWDELDIKFFNDVIGHQDYPANLRLMGYDIGQATSGSPSFVNPMTGDLRLDVDSPCRGQAVSVDVELADGTTWTIPGGCDVGAYQGDDLFRLPLSDRDHDRALSFNSDMMDRA